MTTEANNVATQTVSRLVRDFLAEHSEYRSTANVPLLTRLLEAAYHEVAQGHYIGKNEDQLQNESLLTGLARNHYLDLVNLTAHAASNLPLEEEP